MASLFAHWDELVFLIMCTDQRVLLYQFFHRSFSLTFKSLYRGQLYCLRLLGTKHLTQQRRCTPDLISAVTPSTCLTPKQVRCSIVVAIHLHDCKEDDMSRNL